MYVDAIFSQLLIALLALWVLIQLIIAALSRIARRQGTCRLPVDLGDRAFHRLAADAFGSSRA